MERALKWKEEENENEEDLFASLVPWDAASSSLSVQSNFSTSHLYNFFPPLPSFPTFLTVPSISPKRHRPPKQDNNNNSISSSRLPPSKRRRKETLYDKTRALKRLLPRGGKKMDSSSAAVLEEAYEYLKFLQAQVKSLRSMSLFSGFDVGVDTSSFGGLELLTWQRLLKIVLDSPGNEKWLYSFGCCVFSVNQLGFLQETGRF